MRGNTDAPHEGRSDSNDAIPFHLLSEGARNISNELTIRTNFHKHHKDLYKTAEDRGLWKPGETFDFAKIFTRGNRKFNPTMNVQ